MISPFLSRQGQNIGSKIENQIVFKCRQLQYL